MALFWIAAVAVMLAGLMVKEFFRMTPQWIASPARKR